jgi:hypothetical protein
MLAVDSETRKTLARFDSAWDELPAPRYRLPRLDLLAACRRRVLLRRERSTQIMRATVERRSVERRSGTDRRHADRRSGLDRRRAATRDNTSGTVDRRVALRRREYRRSLFNRRKAEPSR